VKNKTDISTQTGKVINKNRPSLLSCFHFKNICSFSRGELPLFCLDGRPQGKTVRSTLQKGITAQP
jgi:hypothetical protein